jgi:hypothetical protein
VVMTLPFSLSDGDGTDWVAWDGAMLQQPSLGVTRISCVLMGVC